MSNLQSTLIEVLPYPTMLIRRDRTVVFANKVAREVGAVVGGQCWRDFGQSDYISDKDKTYINEHKEKPPCGTHCTFCLADDALDMSSPAIAPEVHAFGKIWETHWIPVSEDIYLHYAFDITERKRMEEKLFEHQEHLRALTSELLLSEEREKQRIAAYLHDHISQTLALGRIEVEGLRKSIGSIDKKVIEDLSRRIKTVIESVQSLTFDLSSPTLYKFGLEKAVDELLDELFEKTEINYKLSHGKIPIQLDNNRSVLLFRGIRELLVNIIKHAGAHKVRVAIRRDGDNIQITINDDGIGFDFDQNELSMSRTGGFGLFNIQERISFIGGSFDIQSQHGKGCQIILMVPIKKEMDLSNGKSDAN